MGERRERLGGFIHSTPVSVGVVALILLSVGLVYLHYVLPEDHPAQWEIEAVQLAITALFVIELGIKFHVAGDKLRFLAQYWIDIIAIVPWAQSLRVLRVLRLLRVFRAALILSRRVRFIGAVFRSAVGEYVVLGLIMLTLLCVGTFALHLSEGRARRRAAAASPPATPPASAAEAPPAELAPDDLADPVNALWATVFFLVANEPMIDVPRTTVGRLVVLGVMFGGLTTFAVFTGIVTALMVNRLRRRLEIDDMDRFQLFDHIVICGWNNQVPLIIDQIQAGMPNTAVVVVADLDDAPPEVQRLGAGVRVFFSRGDYTKPEVLENARIQHAYRAIIVADSTRPRSDQDRDARTVLTALMIERMHRGIYTCAELLNKDNEPHLRAAGIEEVITTSEAGGHHLAMAAMHAGLAEVVSELMTVKVGRNLAKLPVPPELVGLPYLQALERLKRAADTLVIGVERQGRLGPRTPGYAMQVNPEPDALLQADDLLVVITPPRSR